MKNFIYILIISELYVYKNIKKIKKNYQKTVNYKGAVKFWKTLFWKTL